MKPPPATVLVAGLVMVAMGLGGFLTWFAMTDPSVAAPPPTSISGGGDAPSSSSLQVEVHSVLELPSPTATTTPWPTVAPTVDPYDLWVPGQSTPGALYRQPPPTALATPPTPFPICGSEALAAGSLCRAPTPTATPWGE